MHVDIAGCVASYKPQLSVTGRNPDLVWSPVLLKSTLRWKVRTLSMMTRLIQTWIKPISHYTRGSDQCLDTMYYRTLLRRNQNYRGNVCYYKLPGSSAHDTWNSLSHRLFWLPRGSFKHVSEIYQWSDGWHVFRTVASATRWAEQPFHSSVASIHPSLC